MAEDAWLNLPWTRPAESVFQAGWGGERQQQQQQYSQRLPDADRAAWAGVLAARDAVNAVLEKARTAKLIGPALEAMVVVHCSNDGTAAALRGLAAAGNGADDPRFLFITSEVQVAGSAADVEAAAAAAAAAGNGAGGSQCEAVETEAAGVVTVAVVRAAGSKCARCWNYSAAVGSADAEHTELCERCAPVVRAAGFKLPGAGVAAEAKAPVAA